MVARPKRPASRPAVSDIQVVIPAHDEEDWLGECLAALARSVTRSPVPVRTTVVLDACADATASRIPPGVAVLEVECRNVGAARAAGFDAARSGPHTWFATTDADSLVPENWLVAQLRSARQHDVVVGTIRVDDWSPRTPVVARAHDAAYRPVDGHPHVHGANLGLSAAAYARLGGFAPLAVHEDADLVARAEAAGLSVHRSAAMPVTTSARRSHRLTQGFSDTLDRLERGERV